MLTIERAEELNATMVSEEHLIITIMRNTRRNTCSIQKIPCLRQGWMRRTCGQS